MYTEFQLHGLPESTLQVFVVVLKLHLMIENSTKVDYI